MTLNSVEILTDSVFFVFFNVEFWLFHMQYWWRSTLMQWNCFFCQKSAAKRSFLETDFRLMCLHYCIFMFSCLSVYSTCIHPFIYQ